MQTNTTHISKENLFLKSQNKLGKDITNEIDNHINECPFCKKQLEKISNFKMEEKINLPEIGNFKQAEQCKIGEVWLLKAKVSNSSNSHQDLMFPVVILSKHKESPIDNQILIDIVHTSDAKVWRGEGDIDLDGEDVFNHLMAAAWHVQTISHEFLSRYVGSITDNAFNSIKEASMNTDLDNSNNRNEIKTEYSNFRNNLVKNTWHLTSCLMSAIRISEELDIIGNLNEISEYIQELYNQSQLENIPLAAGSKSHILDIISNLKDLEIENIVSLIKNDDKATKEIKKNAIKAIWGNKYLKTYNNNALKMYLSLI